ncbi:MAG: hypothetical protein NC131_15765 [Roseburia sp.]|nr:hypothetical protein [Roseburia sp.]
MQTKFNEVRFTTNDTTEAEGMYLARQLIKKWTEDCIDQSTGEVVSIERNEILMERGTKIDYNAAASINFYIQAGEITEFEVTDQCRAGIYDRGYTAAPWVVTACVKDKNRKFILYAKGVEQALEIAKDYIELKFPGHFEFVAVKGFEDCIAISDNFNRGGAENDTSLPTDDGKEEADTEALTNKFYLIELHITPGGKHATEYDQKFIVFAKDAEWAKDHAEVWLMNRRNAEVDAGNLTPEQAAFTTAINTATLINCYCVIPPDFTREYFEQEKKQEEQEQK